ncbi:hypothetical protein GCM10011348_45890 [Marinobacterium nitratireducens]|uniref:DUF4055 domain-containing protein n=1 Tax=Marinobacterium nitratireducens TaxID=518897 RepID=A0A918DXD3_9GAMM|nr:DUF4055 domain-containing protein [Marinobacterium nitratireducens]GGO89049.1 hypothetical protein GCM10011348_45890 [Marinobacterium nitratireducens]
MADDKKPDWKSPDYKAMSPYWDKVNAIVEGRDAMIAAGQLYLPKFPNESDKDYAFRLTSAKYTNVYRDVVEGLAQKPFSREVALTGDTTPDRVKSIVEDIDGRGNHLHVFAAETFFNGINKAIDWILVDYTRAEGLRTVAEERAAGVRPYWVHVPADNVLNIESEIIEGREQLTLVAILEAKGRVRTFERDGAAVTWRVEVEDDKGDWVLEDEGILTIKQIPMVPFVTGRRKGKAWQFLPPMKDAADLQVELYQQETALKHIKTLTCFPMLAGNGVEPPTDAAGNPVPVPVGPQAVLYAPPNTDGTHGEWKWIGTDAQTLRFLAEDVAATAKELRELGRQPLTAQSGNLTVIAASFASSKGNSAAQAWAMQLKDALEQAFVLTAMWLGIEHQAEVSIFTDFIADDDDIESLTHLREMRKEGDLSAETLWEESKRRGALSPEFTVERESERLLNEVPSGDM